MKKPLVLSVMVILILSLILSVGCTQGETEPYHVDRVITGKVTSIDNELNYSGDYSVLYFGNGLKCEVTNSSLSHWRTDNMFINTWTYKLQETSIKERYDLVGIETQTSE